MALRSCSACGWVLHTQTNSPLDEKDLVIIGGGVAGYVAAIKAGQEGMKVRLPASSQGPLVAMG